MIILKYFLFSVRLDLKKNLFQTSETASTNVKMFQVDTNHKFKFFMAKF